MKGMYKLLHDIWIIDQAFMDQDAVEVYKHARKVRGQYPAILPARVINRCTGFGLHALWLRLNLFTNLIAELYRRRLWIVRRFQLLSPVPLDDRCTAVQMHRCTDVQMHFRILAMWTRSNRTYSCKTKHDHTVLFIVPGMQARDKHFGLSANFLQCYQITSAVPARILKIA